MLKGLIIVALNDYFEYFVPYKTSKIAPLRISQ